MKFESEFNNTGEPTDGDEKKENDFSGGEYLKKKYPDIFKKELREVVDLSYEYSENEEKEGKNKVDVWLEAVENFHKRHHGNPEAMVLVKKAFHEKYAIKPENVPESYFENQQRMARELGHGDREIPEEARSRGIEIIIKDQESTLDNWVNYFFSSDADVYPMWAKYWAVQSVTKLAGYDKERKAFGKRRNDTVAPFPDLNREAFAFVVNIIVKKAKKENIDIQGDDAALKKLIDSENFGKLYAYAVEKVTPTEKKELEVTEGEWVKYDQGSDHMQLVESLQGHGTGWCTAGESTAAAQLQAGDFYVYYSKDSDGKYKNPRVAIRMEGGNIGEVRGIAANQNLDPYIGKVVDEKLAQFPDREKYLKKTGDMELLTAIDKKQKEGQELTDQELKFLYEIDAKIDGFGYEDDPRIQEIIEKRHIKADLTRVTGFAPEEIVTTKEEIFKSGVKLFYGNIDLSDQTFMKDTIFPENVFGNIDFSALRSADNLMLPKKMKGDLDFYTLDDAGGVKFPETIEGSVNLYGLPFVGGLELPKNISGGVNLNNLEYADGIGLPESLAGTLNFYNLKSVEGVVFPKAVGGLHLNSLESPENLILPEIINGELALTNLRYIKGLKFPKIVGGDMDLSFLESAEGAVFPEAINGNFTFLSLKSADGVVFPKAINGNFELGLLESAEGAVFPKTVTGFVNLTRLRSANNLDLPESIGGNLYLSDLKSAMGLKFPERIGGSIYLSNLESADGLILPKVVSGDIDIRNLGSADNLILPESVGGTVYLPVLSSVEKDKLLEKNPNLKIVELERESYQPMSVLDDLLSSEA